MDKLLTYPGKTEKGVHTFLIDHEHDHLVKTASAYHPEVAAYINHAKPLPGITQVLLTAMGAGEYWGSNVNGDWFGEDQLIHEGADYGYKTFQYFAKVFKHHVNKDASANFGDVLLAVYNPVYHRVELVVGIRHDNAYDIVSRIESGNYPVWSMGCKVPFDVCSICGNRAPTRKHYCHHLKYMLNQIDPDTGKQAYAINIRPKFHDISYVVVQADKTAMTLKKVASVVVPQNFPGSALIAEKVSAAQKRSEIDKRIQGDQPPSSQDALTTELARRAAKTILEVKSREPDLPQEVLDRLCSMGPMSEVLSTMNACLIIPKPREFQRIVLVANGRADAADKLDRVNVSFDPAHHAPVTSDHVGAIGLSPARVRVDMIKVLEPFLAERSYSAPLIAKRMGTMVKEARAHYPHPQYVNTERRTDDSGIVPLLGLGSALYAALMLEQKHKTISTLARAVSKYPTVSLGLGVGAIMGGKKVYETVTRPVQRGHFTPTSDLYPDTFDLYDRVERTSAKPYMKVASDETASFERLLVGMPSAFMASHASQRVGYDSPSDYEQATLKVAQELSDVLSGPTRTAAALIEEGNGPGARLPHEQLLKAAGVVEESTPFCSESASISDYVSSSVFGKFSQEGPLDQMILDLGDKLTKLGR